MPFQTSPLRGSTDEGSALVQTRRGEALLGFRLRVASAQKKETPGEAPGVEVSIFRDVVKESLYMTQQFPAYQATEPKSLQPEGRNSLARVRKLRKRMV